MKNKSFTKNKGFTLVETVVSLAILGIMAVMMTGIFSAAANKTAANLRTMQQKERALSQIETVAADGLGAASPGLIRENGTIVINFGGNVIEAKGVYLTGVYGDDKIPARYFYSGN